MISKFDLLDYNTYNFYISILTLFSYMTMHITVTDYMNFLFYDTQYLALCYIWNGFILPMDLWSKLKLEFRLAWF